MAAVTVEDCLKVVPNRFELVLIASHRAKALMNGAPIMYVSNKVEKNTVVALREVGANLLNIETIKDEIKNDVKDQTLFKNYKEDSILGDKKDEEEETNSVDGNLPENFAETDDSNTDITNDNDDEYYNNLDDSSSNDLSDDIDDNDLV